MISMLVKLRPVIWGLLGAAPGACFRPDADFCDSAVEICAQGDCWCVARCDSASRLILEVVRQPTERMSHAGWLSLMQALKRSSAGFPRIYRDAWAAELDHDDPAA